MIPILLNIAYLLAIGLSLYTSGWLIVKAHRNRTTAALAACQLLIIIWCIPQLFLPLITAKEPRYLAYAISYIGICFIGPAWLIFSFLYCRRRLKRAVAALLFTLSALDYSILLTNGLHHLFYRRFEVTGVVYGPVFYFHMICTYLCVVGGMAVVLNDFRKKRVAPIHMRVIILSAAIPLSFNLLSLSGLVHAGFDLTPPAFSLSSLLMLLAVFRYDFLDVNTAAFEQIFDSVSEGIVLYNKKGTVTYCNVTAEKWLGISVGTEFQELSLRLTGLGLGTAPVPDRELSANEFPDSEFPDKNLLLTLQDGKQIRISQSIHRSRNGTMLAGTFLLTDVSGYYERLRQNRELAVSNQRLAIEQERNRIAQEVHDTTGHTLTMIQSLLKLTRFSLEKTFPVQEFSSQGSADHRLSAQEPSVSEAPDISPLDYLSQAQELASNGIRELRCSINNLRQSGSGELVTQGIRQLADSVREIPVEVEIQGEDGPACSHLSHVVCQCLREAITNCLKYASASRMDVIVKFTPDTLSLYIFDDGNGCDDIRESNGIRGIRSRVEKAGGQARFLSSTGEGFQIYIRLPVKGV